MKLENMIKDVFKKSYDIFLKDFVSLIVGSVIALILMIFIVTIPPLIFGIYCMCVSLAKGKKVQIKDVFKGFNYFFRSWWLMIIALVLVTIGLALLVIPGLLLMVMFQYAISIAIMENKSAIESLKKSYAIAKKNFSFSIVLLILLAVIQSIGGLTRVGVLITIPFTMLCTVVALTKLKG